MFDKMSVRIGCRSRVIFLLSAFAVCLLLSFRVIPDIEADNDTGRYVQEFENVCENIETEISRSSISWRSFNLISSSVCFADSKALFLLLASAALPLSFLIFSSWKRGNLLLGIGFLLSTFSFELMTNALRQGFSLFFLVGAFSNANKFWKSAFAFAAVLLHDSSWIFAPLLIIFMLMKINCNEAYRERLRFHTILGLSVVFFLGCILFLLQYAAGFLDFWSVFSEKYAEPQNVYFSIFMIMPIFWNYLIRSFEFNLPADNFERITFVYILLLLISILTFMPFIAYRFILSAIVIQTYIIMQKSRISSMGSILISAGFIVHMLVFLVVGSNVRNVLFGL